LLQLKKVKSLVCCKIVSKIWPRPKVNGLM